MAKKGDAFNRQEVTSSYVDAGDRWIVSYIVGIPKGEAGDPVVAAQVALDVLLGEESGNTSIAIFDRESAEIIELTRSELEMFSKASNGQDLGPFWPVSGMSTEVRFEIDAARVEDHYGLTLMILDSAEDPDDGDDVSCYFLVFKGPRTGEPNDAAVAFSACHQSAMDSVGLEGEVSEEEFEQKLEDSIELAGALMEKHGYEVQQHDLVDQHTIQALFKDMERTEQDIRQMN